MPRETKPVMLLQGKKIAVGILFDTVSIEIICDDDDYEAQVTYDDIVDRLERGESLTLIAHAADNCTFVTSETRREAFRAALTAAAQVRGRMSGKTTNEMTAEAGAKRFAGAPVGLMPIYGSTEDLGEDVLGYRPPDGE